MRSREILLLSIIIASAIWWFLKEPVPVAEDLRPNHVVEVHSLPKPLETMKPLERFREPVSSHAVETDQKVPQKTATRTAKERTPKGALAYKMDDGLMVVTGDIVIGEPVSPDAPDTGYVEMPQIKLWPRVIPYHIQPHLSNPERIEEALKKFEGTSLHFVPYTNQKDVLVFDERPGHCKSYLGRIGGKQPIWLSPNCDAGDIAHEIMHALGFIHEQNRVDRDQYVKVLWDNIEEAEKINFELLPQELMVLTGGSPFDYNSIMIYDPQSFAKGPGLLTLQSLKRGQEIKASSWLSPSDFSRIERVYEQ